MHTLGCRGIRGGEEQGMTPKVRDRSASADLALVACPECGAPAEVEWRDVAASSAAPAEHVKIRCLQGHEFLMLAETLTPR